MVLSLDNKYIPPEELRENILSFLKQYKSAALATCLGDNPRCSPVQYFMGEDMDIYVVSAGGEKFKAIEENPNVCLLVNTEYIDYRRIKGVQVFGTATTSMENKDLFNEVLKYAPEPYIIETVKETVNIIKIIPNQVVYLDSLETGDRTKQILEQDRVIIKEDELTLV